ncbi:hypothetical protein M917_1731 [Psychrobacter aquaticus CMS 56]|uniref:Uncharacterized protein n=1 Tax=Psychrobacter aquaticus CMS 56 TaxID=1354303 RepID=U4T9T2_9GAMM|nr:hypothetical protein M917_1731 [Psychrobacter aquaticus CMS 56]
MAASIKIWLLLAVNRRKTVTINMTESLVCASVACNIAYTD